MEKHKKGGKKFIEKAKFMNPPFTCEVDRRISLQWRGFCFGLEAMLKAGKRNLAFLTETFPQTLQNNASVTCTRMVLTSTLQVFGFPRPIKGHRTERLHLTSQRSQSCGLVHINAVWIRLPLSATTAMNFWVAFILYKQRDCLQRLFLTWTTFCPCTRCVCERTEAEANCFLCCKIYEI